MSNESENTHPVNTNLSTELNTKIGDLVLGSYARKAVEALKCIDDSVIQKKADFIQKVYKCLANGGKLIVYGNGGSSADASHFCAELTGRFKKDRKPYPALCLNDATFLTAVGNDYGFDCVFERGVYAFARPEDMVIGITTSGVSLNIRNAEYAAGEVGCSFGNLVGRDNSFLAKKFGSVSFRMDGGTDAIQEAQMRFLHTTVEIVERMLAEGGL